MSPRKKFILILIVCAVLLVTTSFGYPLHRLISAAVEASHSPWVGEEIVVAGKNNSEYEPAIAFNWKHKEYLVVWRGFDGIYGQRVSTTGKLVGPTPFPIATGTKTRRKPSVDYDPLHDRYLVVWMYDKGSPDWNINGRFIPWQGPDQSLSEFEIITFFTSEEYPKVVYARATEEFLLVWVEVEKAKNVSEIWGVRLKSMDGTIPVGEISHLISKAGELCNHPDVAYNLKRNEYLVTWEVIKSSLDIYGVRLKGDAQPMQPGIFKIAGWPDDEGSPAVAAIGDADQYLVVWQSEVAPNNQDIFARIVFGDAVLSTTVHHIEWTTVNEIYPDVSSDRSGSQFLVVWQQQYSSTSGPYGISGRMVFPVLGGSILCPGCGNTADTVDSLGDIFTIVSPYIGDPDRTKPAVTGGFAQFLTVWEYLRPGSTDQDIHGKLVIPHAVFLPLVIRK